MGFADTQRKRNDRRIDAALEGRLEPGEDVVTAFPAMTQGRAWIAILLLFPVLVYFAVTGNRVPPGVTGGIIGILIVWTMRWHFVVLTDRRVLVLLLRRMSSKAVETEHAVARSAASGGIGDGFLNDKLTLQAGDRSYDLRIARLFRERAQTLASQLGRPPRSL